MAHSNTSSTSYRRPMLGTGRSSRSVYQSRGYGAGPSFLRSQAGRRRHRKKNREADKDKVWWPSEDHDDRQDRTPVPLTHTATERAAQSFIPAMSSLQMRSQSQLQSNDSSVASAIMSSAGTQAYGAIAQEKDFGYPDSSALAIPKPQPVVSAATRLPPDANITMTIQETDTMEIAYIPSTKVFTDVVDIDLSVFEDGKWPTDGIRCPLDDCSSNQKDASSHPASAGTAAPMRGPFFRGQQLCEHLHHAQLKAHAFTAREEYLQVLENHKGSDVTQERDCQTFNNTHRDKEVGTNTGVCLCTQPTNRFASVEVHMPPRDVSTVGVAVNEWEIYDAYHQRKDKQEADLQQAIAQHVEFASATAQDEVPVVNTSGAPAGAGAGSSGLTLDQAQMSSRGGTMLTSALPSQLESRATQASSIQPASKKVSALELLSQLSSFRRAAKVMERAVIQNTLHTSQQLYRGQGLLGDDALGDVSAELKQAMSMALPANTADANANPSATSGIGDEKTTAPGLLPLWRFDCPETKGMSVMCMDWNRENQDLLAVGYGSAIFGNNSTGCVALWTLKNPNHPEKILKLPFGVSAIDFCSESPHLLAVGCYDGTVAIFDIRSGGLPVLESSHIPSSASDRCKHSEPVWGLKWVYRTANKEGGQFLVSISSDGRVFQWSMKKGLVPSELMLLKRVPNPELAMFHPPNPDGVSRRASGLCFDFPESDDSQTYLAGTEDGLVHKCSVSYNEQTLQTYHSHTGAVHKVRFSPFVPGAFLTCSADWTCCLWTQNISQPRLRFEFGQHYVYDIQWCPFNSCIFATVTANGQVQVWDIACGKNVMDPLIDLRVGDAPLRCAVFGQTAPVLCLGDEDGAVHVFSMIGLDLQKDVDAGAQREKLQQAIAEHSSNDQTRRRRVAQAKKK